MPRPQEVEALQPVAISTHRQLQAVGMSDKERLQQLSETPSVIPPRQIRAGEANDPFGLLEHEDTYEVLAGMIFQECEGIFHQLVKGGYEDVGEQFRKAHKKPDKVPVINFPEVQLTDLYKYGMSRATDSISTQYLFHRTDPGYEEKGFRVIKQDNGHVVLQNVDPAGTDTDNDQAYYLLLHNAQQWVQDYAAQLNIPSANLLNLARTNIEPPTLRQKAAKAGANAADLAIGALGGLTTKATHYGRRPRWAVLATMAALVPIPGAHEIVGEAVLHGGEAVVGGVISGGDAAGTEIGRITVGTADVFIGWFDTIHHLYTPEHYGPTQDIALGSTDQTIIFDGSYSLSKQANTPLMDGGRGQIAPGTTRRIDPSATYPKGFKGIKVNQCTTTTLRLPGAKSIEIFDTDPDVANDLSVTPSNNSLMICNTAGQDIPEQNLEHIFIEPES